MNEEIKDKIKKVNWWHSINLGEYGITDGVQQSIMDTLKMPDKFTGKTVLDIGTVDGFYAFEAEKRNAKRILAADSLAWRNESYSAHKLTTGKDGFNLAREILNSKVEDIELEDFNEDICIDKLGKHDIVLCLGILYHMMDPFRFIRKLSEITNELLILETHTDVNNNYAWKIYGPPLMAFYPTNELNNDESNWWGPNAVCVREMLKAAGFEKIELKFMSPAGRTVFHAYKTKDGE